MALEHAARCARAVLGGLGDRLVRSAALPSNIAEAMEAPSLNDLTEPMQRMFRAFAEATKSDLRALAACIRGNRQSLTPKGVAAIACPTLVAVGTRTMFRVTARRWRDCSRRDAPSRFRVAIITLP